jgi:hypothetical protein
MSIVADNIPIAISLVSAVATFITIFFAYKAIKATKQSLEAQLLYDLLKKYSTEGMLKHVRTLRNFKADNSDVAKAYIEQRVDGNDLDLARRAVSQYYQRVSRLREADYVTDLFVKTVCDPDTPMLLREIVIPIEKAHTENYNEKYLEDLLKIIEKKS